MTFATTTCPEPHPQAICVLSLDQFIAKTLPTLGFSNEYDQPHLSAKRNVLYEPTANSSPSGAQDKQVIGYSCK
jgi:hypothetical protein